MKPKENDIGGRCLVVKINEYIKNLDIESKLRSSEVGSNPTIHERHSNTFSTD